MNGEVRFVLGIFLFLGFFGVVFGVDVGVNVSESSTLTKLLDERYSLVADGVITITNPSVVSTIYEVNFPLKLDALIGVTVNLVEDNVSFVSNLTSFEFSYEAIKGRFIEPNSTVKVAYRIYGILEYDLYSRMKSQNKKSVLDYYVKSYDFMGNTILNLEKPIQEGLLVNSTNGKIINDSGNSLRFVSCGIRNPTEFELTIRSLKVYRGTVGVNNSFFDVTNGLVGSKSDLKVEPFGFAQVEMPDSASNSSSVYWLSANAVLSTSFVWDVSSKFTIYKPSNGGGMGANTPFDSSKFSSVLVKKSTDKSLVLYGEEVKVFVRIVNVNEFNISDLEVTDILPVGFELVSVDSEAKVLENKLVFKIGNVEGYDTVVLSYTLRNKKDSAGISYLMPAKLVFKGQEYFSQGVLLVHNLLADKKIFIQKEVDYADENYAKVTIKVKNLGSISVEDLIVSDVIDEAAVIKDISQFFYEGRKGVWRISELDAGDEWEVTYLVERNAGLENLPNLFGIDKGEVLGTLIFSEEVITIFKEEPKVIEKVGLGVAIGLLVFYLLF